MFYVYRYTDLRDDIVKYIGITKRKLQLRVKEHDKQDDWLDNLVYWDIDYFCVKNQSEAEAWESHLISEYCTYNWYNKGKADWGSITSFTDITVRWNMYISAGIFVDIDYNKYRLIDDFTGLVSETTIKLETNIDDLYFRKLIGMKTIIPVARDENNLLWFCEYDRQRVIKLAGLV